MKKGNPLLHELPQFFSFGLCSDSNLIGNNLLYYIVGHWLSIANHEVPQCVGITCV